MAIETRKLLEDIHAAAEHIAGFTAARAFDDYQADVMLRSAVERQFEIIGEALARLVRLDPSTAGRISHQRRIIDFRNVLIHGYDAVDDAIVWDVIRQDLPTLHRQIVEWIAEEGSEP